MVLNDSRVSLARRGGLCSFVPLKGVRQPLCGHLELAHDPRHGVHCRSQVGGGGRSEKIRTYNFKENRVTDHRIGFTIYRLADVLGGDLDDVVRALQADERARQLADGDG